MAAIENSAKVLLILLFRPLDKTRNPIIAIVTMLTPFNSVSKFSKMFIIMKLVVFLNYTSMIEHSEHPPLQPET